MSVDYVLRGGSSGSMTPSEGAARRDDLSSPLLPDESSPLSGREMYATKYLDDDSDAVREPSSVLFVIFAVGLVVGGVGGMALPRALMYAIEGHAWFTQQVWILGTMNIVGLGCAAMSAGALAPQVRRALANVPTGTATGVEPRWDTLKYFLTQLVSISHFMAAPCWNYAWWFAFWNFKEMFLMQCYVFISGYLSPPVPNQRRLQALWKSVIGAYIVNQSLTCLLYAIGYQYSPVLTDGTSGPGAGFNFFWEIFDSQAALWYLANLMMWRGAAPFFVQLKHPIFWSVAMAIWCKYMSTYNFSDNFDFMKANSAVVFFPYYLLGILVRKHSAAFHAVLEWRATHRAAFAAFTACLVLNLVNYAQRWNVFDFFAKCGSLCDESNHWWFNQYVANGKDSFHEKCVRSPVLPSFFVSFLYHVHPKANRAPRVSWREEELAPPPPPPRARRASRRCSSQLRHEEPHDALRVVRDRRRRARARRNPLRRDHALLDPEGGQDLAMTFLVICVRMVPSQPLSVTVACARTSPSSGAASTSPSSAPTRSSTISCTGVLSRDRAARSRARHWSFDPSVSRVAARPSGRVALSRHATLSLAHRRARALPRTSLPPIVSAARAGTS